MNSFLSSLNFGELSLEEFLSEYWQKKPYLFRQALPNFQSPISADELAGFSLDSDVNARLVIENPEKNTWEVKHSPLREEDFQTLPAKHWTLLVQHADSLDPEINALLRLFRFIPNWRLDDIMVSYSPAESGVGPHFDYYDVFLLQADGQRRWKIGQHCDTNSALVPDQAMKILQEFDTQEEWITEPGDVLYIPPHIAHWGSSINESITYSIGFRAPSDTDLLLDYTQLITEKLSEDQRFRDEHIIPSAPPGEIPSSAIESLQQRLQRHINQPHLLAHWLTEYATEMKTEIQFPNLAIDHATLDDWQNDRPVKLSGFCRCAYTQTENELICYVNGTAIACSLACAQQLSEYKPLRCSELSSEDADCINRLITHSLIELYDNQD